MIERLDANRDRVVECKGPVGHNSQKNSRNRAVKTNSLSVDFGCTSEVDRECVVERRGPSMKERDKLGGEQMGGSG